MKTDTDKILEILASNLPLEFFEAGFDYDDMKAFIIKIQSLQSEIEILKNPTCEKCDSFAFNMCQHFRSRDCYLYHRGGTVSLFKLREVAES